MVSLSSGFERISRSAAATIGLRPRAAFAGRSRRLIGSRLRLANIAGGHDHVRHEHVRYANPPEAPTQAQPTRYPREETMTESTRRPKQTEVTPGNEFHLGLPFVLANRHLFNFWDIHSGNYFIEMEGEFYGWDSATIQVAETGPG